MAFSQSHIHKIHPKGQKKRLTDTQVKLLEASFHHDKKLEQEEKLYLAKELGLHPRQVAVWYQNKKARWKTQALEQDHHALQQRLENALEEKRVMEEELKALRKELDMAKEMLGFRGNDVLFAGLSSSGNGDEGSPHSTVQTDQKGGGSYLWEKSELYSEFTLFAAHSIS